MTATSPKKKQSELDKIEDDEIKEAVLKDLQALAKDNSAVFEENVYLRVYDLSNGFAKIHSEKILGIRIDGVWHTSIEVFGMEYYIQDGLKCSTPGNTPYGQCIERIHLGITDCAPDVLCEFIESIKEEWSAMYYDLFDNNCNHFSDQLANFLLDRGIPSHILELSEKVKSAPGFRLLFGRKD